jgi:hypothetical protein
MVTIQQPKTEGILFDEQFIPETENGNANEPQDLEHVPFGLLESTKEQRASYVAAIISNIQDGYVNPLKAHIQLKALEEILCRLTDKKKFPETAIPYGDMVLTEAQKYGAKGFEMHNSKVKISEVGTRYDYSFCQDPVWSELNSKIEALSELKRIREDMLKKVPEKGLVLTDEDTGETNTVYPPGKICTTSVVITLK